MKKQSNKDIEVKRNKDARRDSIVPFKERPSDNRNQGAPSRDSSKLNAAQLFSLFTADIIREDVPFTR